jgi:hypothetical protein
MNDSNPFDEASRYLLKLAPVGLFLWATGSQRIADPFKRWLDSRDIVLPGEPDHISDLVLEDLSE